MSPKQANSPTSTNQRDLSRVRCRSVPRSQIAKRSEIEYTFTPRIEPGDYLAVSRAAKRYFDAQYKRWVCAIHFDIVKDSVAMEPLERLTWFLNLGAKTKPSAGRRTRFWSAWVHANGGPPKRGDRLTLKVFIRRLALVRVEDTSKTFNASHAENPYSVIRDVIEWQTGGGPR